MTQECRRGFTLIELMVVIVILGVLGAILIPNLFRSVHEARVGAARTQMAELGKTVEMYALERRRLPDSLAQLTEPSPHNPEPYLRFIPRDPWNQDYEYLVLSRRRYEIRCLGADGVADTGDDLRHPVVLDR